MNFTDLHRAIQLSVSNFSPSPYLPLLRDYKSAISIIPWLKMPTEQQRTRAYLTRKQPVSSAWKSKREISGGRGRSWPRIRSWNTRQTGQRKREITLRLLSYLSRTKYTITGATNVCNDGVKIFNWKESSSTVFWFISNALNALFSINCIFNWCLIALTLCI